MKISFTLFFFTTVFAQADFLQDALKNAPILEPHRTVLQASYERSSQNPTLHSIVANPGNSDFNRFLKLCGSLKSPLLHSKIYRETSSKNTPCPKGYSGAVIGHQKGAGTLSRLFLTSMKLTFQNQGYLFGDESLLIFIDGNPTPAKSIKLRHVETKKVQDPYFQSPLGGYRSGALVSDVPLSFQKEVTMLLTHLEPTHIYYFQSQFQMLEKQNKPVFSRNPPDLLLQNKSDLKKNDQKEIASSSIPGVVKNFRVSLEASDLAMKDLENIRLHGYFDGKKTLDIPLSAFFQTSLGGYSIHNSGFSSSHLNGSSTWSFQFRLPMPYKKEFKLELSSNIQKNIDWESQALVNPGPNPYQTHLYTFSSVFKPKKNEFYHKIFSVNSPGAFVGTLIEAKGNHAPLTKFVKSNLAFLEGDEVWKVDGKYFRGTGLEDFIGGGWYFRDGPFTSIFAGVTKLETKKEVSDFSAYRFFLGTQKVNFQKEFSLYQELGALEPNSVQDLKTTSFVYLPQGFTAF